MPDILEEEREDEKIRHTITNNIKASLVTNVFYLATRLGIPPFVLTYVSLAEYGLWSYCFIILSYLGMGVFGVTNVYVRYAAIFFAKRDYTSINRLISTGVFSIAVTSSCLLTLLWFGIPWLLSLFNVGEDLQQTAFILIIGTTLIFIADLTLGVFGYILQSLQLIVAEKTIWTISFTVESLAIIILLLNGQGIYSLLWAFAIRTLISLSLSAYVAKNRLPSLALSPRLFSKHMLKLFLNFGGIVQLAGLLGIINRSIKKVLAGTFIGLEATGLYEVGEKFPVMSLNLPGSITAVFLPAASQFHANGEDERIIQVYVKGSRLINLLTGSMMGFMAAFSIPLINAWLGINPVYEIAASILSWFTIAYQMDTLTGPVSAIYRAINEPQKELYYGFFQFFLTVTAAAIGFYYWEPSIPVINFTVATMMVLAACIYLYMSNSFLNISHRRYFKSVILPGLYPYLIGYSLWFLSSPWFHAIGRIQTVWRFFVCLGLYIAIWLPILYWFILSKVEQQELKKRLKIQS